MQDRRVQVGFFVALITLVLVLSYFIFKPYITALFLSLILYISFEPLFQALLRFTQEKRWLASLLTVTFIVVIILFPFIFFGFFLFEDAKDLYTRVSSEGLDHNIIHEWATIIQGHVNTIIPIVTIDIEQYMNKFLGLIVGNLDTFFSSFLKVLVSLFIVLLSLFYLFRDGEKLRRTILVFSPLADTDDQKIFDRIKLAVNSVVRGSLFIALIQGMLVGLGFAIFGIPSAFLWGAVAAVMALVPTLGTSLVVIPGVVYLFLNGHSPQATGLLVWGMVAVGLVDNFLGPILIKRGIKIHPFLILLSVLGGIAFFGPIGFVAGPVVLSLLLMLLSMYPLIIENRNS